MSVLLSLDAVSKRYRRGTQSLFGRRRELRAVDGIDLTIVRGRSLGLVGESGCGKSTLAKIAARLIEPSEGAVKMEVGQPETGRRRVQMVFQDPLTALDARMGVGAQIEEALGTLPRRFSKAERAARRDELLDQVGLSSTFAGRYPHQLSGGQRQRVVIARALAAEPQLLICDEPLAALDVSVQAQIIALLHHLAQARGLTYLFITHQLSTVRHLCADVAVMYAGRIVEQGPVAQVFQSPRHPYTRMLLSSVVDPRVSRTLDAAVIGEPPDPANLPSGCTFHPRCTLKSNVCAWSRPELRRLADDRRIACHLTD